jgi:Nif-specific regulatory protein
MTNKSAVVLPDGDGHAEDLDPSADLLECVATFWRSLDQKFDPARFLFEFSTRAQRLVPHDYMLIQRREGDGHTCSTFAECAVRGPLLGQRTHYTTSFERGVRVPAEVFALRPVFEGDTQIIADMTTDPRFAENSAWGTKLAMAELRRVAGSTRFARLAAPLSAGGRVTGALVVMSGTAGVYTEAHAASCRRLADLIGPFVETVVALQCERRRRERLNAAVALPAVLGASLTVGDVLERLGKAIRPLVDFDGMSLSLLAPAGHGFERIGWIGHSLPEHPPTTTIEDYSVAERVTRGDAVLIRDAARELDPRRSGDRRMIDSGDQSILCVPLLFGERVGGSLLFASKQVHWYDESDLEIGSVIAIALVIAIQHQRLAEQQQRLGAVETKAQKLERQAASLRTALDDQFGFDAVIGRAPKLVAAVEDARKVAATGTTVLLTGESGTGKEILARAIHYASARSLGPFVALNCAALPETLAESELFGHERGAFTGADRLKRGRFDLASGGTLFLDEAGELTPAVQAKLLRVLQERKYERVGGTATLEANVRLIAASNGDLEAAVAQGRFREDLFYRLAVFRIHLPPLRERGDDVLLLADHFVRELGLKMGILQPGMNAQARELLLAHAWPGNIRELQNAIERALIRAAGELISAEHLGIVPRPRDVTIPAVTSPPMEAVTAVLTIAEQERRMISDALRRTKGNKTRAAAALGLSPTQLFRRLRRLGVTPGVLGSV